MLAFVFKSPCIHFSQCFILPFPPLYLRRWLNTDDVDGFLLCNNQSNEGKRIFRGLKRLKSTVFTFHMKASVLERREVCHLQGTFMCRSSVSWMHVVWVCSRCWAKRKEKKNGATAVLVIFFSCFYLNWRTLCVSVVWEYFRISGHDFRIPVSLLMRLIFLNS